VGAHHKRTSTYLRFQFATLELERVVVALFLFFKTRKGGGVVFHDDDNNDGEIKQPHASASVLALDSRHPKSFICLWLFDQRSAIIRCFLYNYGTLVIYR
jgi:hypothetical protein